MLSRRPISPRFEVLGRQARQYRYARGWPLGANSPYCARHACTSSCKSAGAGVPEMTCCATSFAGCINIFFDPSLNQTGTSRTHKLSRTAAAMPSSIAVLPVSMRTLIATPSKQFCGWRTKWRKTRRPERSGRALSGRAATLRHAQNQVLQMPGRTGWMPQPDEPRWEHGVSPGLRKSGASTFSTVQHAVHAPQLRLGRTGPRRIVSRSGSACISAKLLMRGEGPQTAVPRNARFRPGGGRPRVRARRAALDRRARILASGQPHSGRVTTRSTHATQVDRSALASTAAGSSYI